MNKTKKRALILGVTVGAALSLSQVWAMETSEQTDGQQREEKKVEEFHSLVFIDKADQDKVLGKVKTAVGLKNADKGSLGLRAAYKTGKFGSNLAPYAPASWAGIEIFKSIRRNGLKFSSFVNPRTLIPVGATVGTYLGGLGYKRWVQPRVQKKLYESGVEGQKKREAAINEAATLLEGRGPLEEKPGDFDKQKALENDKKALAKLGKMLKRVMEPTNKKSLYKDIIGNYRTALKAITNE